MSKVKLTRGDGGSSTPWRLTIEKGVTAPKRNVSLTDDEVYELYMAILTTHGSEWLKAHRDFKRLKEELLECEGTLRLMGNE